MSNLWAALLATNEGTYPFEVEGDEVKVNALDEARFDRLAGKYSFGLNAVNGTRLCEGGVVWTQVQGSRRIEAIRNFYYPPTVLFTKGAKAVALWAVRPAMVWSANEQFARLFGGRIKDANPLDYRLNIKGYRQEWRMNALYDIKELTARCA